ncbi:MAG: hypothetical protein IJS00_05115 [Paludibacteraceae bacterium]|nr:hypothetical protein [Paludibacteraceae bacterium]
MSYPIKYSSATINDAIQTMAKQLVANQIVTDQTVFIVLLNGGVWFASHLFDALGDLPNEVYYAKCHSYDGQTRKELMWDYQPQMNITGRDVVVLDDICDSGQTATAVVRALQQSVKSVAVVTLLKRETTHINDIPLYSCITDHTDDFFVGCGLDDNGRNRMLPFIGIVAKG